MSARARRLLAPEQPCGACGRCALCRAEGPDCEAYTYYEQDEDPAMAELKKTCTDHSPSWFVGHWREWHRGHGCEQDDGKPRSDAATIEIKQHAANAGTGFLTDAELRHLRAATTSGNTLLVRALDELATRRKSAR